MAGRKGLQRSPSPTPAVSGCHDIDLRRLRASLSEVPSTSAWLLAPPCRAVAAGWLCRYWSVGTGWTFLSPIHTWFWKGKSKCGKGDLKQFLIFMYSLYVRDVSFRIQKANPTFLVMQHCERSCKFSLTRSISFKTVGPLCLKYADWFSQITGKLCSDVVSKHISDEQIKKPSAVHCMKK